MGHYRQGFAWHDNVAKEFNYHPLFMIIGMVFLYGNGMTKHWQRIEFRFASCVNIANPGHYV